MQKSTPPKLGKRGKVLKKVQKENTPFKLVDEEEDVQQEPKPQGKGDDPILELAKKMSLDSIHGEGEGADADYELAVKMSLDSLQAQSKVLVGGVAIPSRTFTDRSVKEEKYYGSVYPSKMRSSTHDSTTGPSSQPQDDTSEKVVHESSSPTDSERIESGTEADAPKVVKERGEEASTTVAHKEKIADRAEDQARPDPRNEDEALVGSNPEPMNEDFYAAVYPKVHENLKHKTDEHVIVENPESPSGTLSSIKNLDDTDNFWDQFLNDKSTDDVSSPQPSLPPVSAPLITAITETPTTILALPPPPPTQISIDSELAVRVADLEKRNADLEHAFTTQHKTINNLSSIIFNLEHRDLEYMIDNYVRNTVKDFVHMAFRALLLQSFADLFEGEMKQILHNRMFESGSYKSHDDHEMLYNALKLSMSRNNMEALHEGLSKKRKRHRDDQDPPSSPNDDDQDHPPSPPKDSDQSKKRRHHSDASSSNPPPPKDSEQSTKKQLDSGASASRQHSAQTSSAWQITDTRDAPPGSSMQRSEPQSEQYSDDTPIPDVEHDSDPEDTDNAHLPKANVFATTYQDPKENKLLRKTGDMGSFIKWFCKQIGKKKLSKADLEDKVDLVNPEGHLILRNVYELLPLGGPLGDKERNSALSISKLKAAQYLDFGLEELVSSLWIESEQEYDISTAYGITHWWFRRKEFYINKHRGPSDHHAVRSQIRILSVISIKSYERYGYNYLREIVLRRADYKEYKILENDFKNLHPNDFEDLYLLHLHDKLNHLPKSDKVNLHTAVNLWIKNIVIKKRMEDLQLGIKSYQTKLNLEQPNWDASDFLFKEDYTIVYKPRVVIYKDRNDQKKMMRENEGHKFSDGTLMRIQDKLAFMVKDFKLFEFNKGMKNRKWTEDDKRRSEDFIEVIERRLKIRRIFQSLESFVGGRLRDIDYRRTVSKDRPCIVFYQSYKVGKASYERSHKGVKASAYSDIVYFFTSAQDGDILQDDERLYLADDLKKAQDHNQRQANDESKDYYPNV
ncbi:hypothetical protein Tco_0529990 [Tanacetum coccineum]